MGRKFLLSIIFLLFALYVGYYFGFPAILNNPANFQRIENYAKQSGYNFAISNPVIKREFIPSINFSADNFSILNDDNSKALDINSLNINVRLLPLLFKKVNIKQLSVQDINVNFVYDTDKKFKLGQYTFDNIPKTDFNINPKNVNIRNINAVFDNKITSKSVVIKSSAETGKDGKINAVAEINNNAKIDSIFTVINNGLIINNLSLKGKNVNAHLSGVISRLNARIPELDLKISLDKSRAEDILALIPDIPNISPDIDIMLIKKTGFWGNASANLEIKGKADTPDVFGNVLITDAYAVKPILNADKATIKIAFEGQNLDLNVFVPTSKTQKVWVKGPINLYGSKSADLYITSTDSVDLKTAQIILNPLHEIFYFDLGPVPIMDIKGQGGINLKVSGTRQNPYAWGEFNFKNAVVSFLDIHNMEITNGSGVLKFDNQNTEFESKTAFLNGKSVKIKGTCTLLGVLNFDVSTKNQDLGKLVQIIKTSPMLKEVQELVKPFESASGLSDITINLTGKVKDVNDIVFNKNIFAKGSIILYNNTVKMKNLLVNGVSGNVNFDNLDANFDLKSLLGNSQLKIDGKIKNNVCDLKVVTPKINLGDALKDFNLPKDFSTINSSLNAIYKGKLDDIEYEKLSVDGKIFSNRGAKSSLIVNKDCYFELKNSNLKISKLEGLLNGSPYYLNLNGNRIFSKNRFINGYAKINGLDLNILKSVNLLLPADLSEQLNNIEFINGKTDITARVKNNRYNIYTVLDNISFLYKPNNIKINFNSGNVLLHDGILNLNKINSTIDDMPVFADGKIYNTYKKPNLNLYLNLKPSQNFIDLFFNKNAIYPIKLKGDVILTSKITGNINNINAKSTLDIKENSSLYYMGALIGDVENPVKIAVDNNFYQNKIKINNLKYDKIISSQNNKPVVNTQLNAQGTLSLLNDGNIAFNNFKIKTENPTDAKIFNIIFRKPFMKQGVFTSDIILNGTSLYPKILGKLNVNSIDIPFFDSTVRDINLDFKNDKIFLSSNGKVLANEVILDAVMVNRLIPPYIIDNLNLKMADLNINKITDTLRDIEAESTRNLSVRSNDNDFDITQLIVRNAEISADKIQVRNINADNFNANLKITDKKQIDVENFEFNLAQGLVNGKFNYDIPSKVTNLDIHLNNANAAIMSEALFDLKGQVFGSVNGDFKLACIGNSNDNCFKTLFGSGTFKISDGKMPKLGSLEYLLKAGNIWKGGIAGFSINSLIDLVTPLKTGSFESISGDIHIADGVADKINIYSSGNDLNMFMTGSYNILSSVADMEIFGSLSKNITTVFGKIKNMSLNTLFNTIPGVNDDTEKLLLQTEISKIPNIKNVTDIYRIFAVEINGDINGTDYVKSFRWVK